MKRVLSVILACLLTLGCFASLGGCGKSAPLYTGKKGFIENQTYFTALSDVMSKPVVALESAQLEKLNASDKAKGMKFDVTLDELKGIDGLLSGVTSGSAPTGQLSLLSMLLDCLPIGFGGALSLEGESLLGALSIIFDGKPVTLNAKLDGQSISLTLPGLLEEVLKVDLAELIPAFGGLAEMAPSAEGSVESTQSNVSTAAPSQNDLPSLMAVITTAIAAAEASLPSLEKLWDNFTEGLDSSFFSDTVGTLPTADGDAEYKAIAFEIKGGDLLKAAVSTLKALTEGTEFDEDLKPFAELTGLSVDELKKNISDALAELEDENIYTEANELSVSWTRYTDSSKICADKLTVDVDGDGATLFMGITSSKSGEYGFFKLTDSSDTELMAIESTVSEDSAVLTVEADADGEAVKLTFNGKNEVVDGKPSTVSSVSVGSGGMTVNLFTLTTTVNDATADSLDLSGKLELKLPTGMMDAGGSDVGITLSFNLAVGDITAVQSDFSGKVISLSDLESTGEELLKGLIEKLETVNPSLHGILSTLLYATAIPSPDLSLTPQGDVQNDGGFFF